MNYKTKNTSWLFSNTNIICVLVLFRILYLFFVFYSFSSSEWQSWTEMPDSSGYFELAEDLNDLRLDTPSYRTPGYAFVISLLSRVDIGDLHMKVLIFQQLVDGLIAYLILKILSGMNKRLALVPAILYLLHPYSLLYSSFILPATYAALFVIFASYLLLKKKNVSIRRAVGIGLVLSAGIMIRPMLIYSSFIFSGYLLLVNRKRFKKLIVPVVVLIISSSIFPYLLTQYNKTEFDMNSISSQGNFELAARIAILTGTLTQAEVFCERGFKDSIESIAMTDGLIDYDIRDSIYSDIGIKLFKQNPLPVIKSHLFGWLGFIGLKNTQQHYFRLRAEDTGSFLNRSLQLYILINTLIMYPGMLLGLFQRHNKMVKNLSFLALLWFAYVSVVHAALCGPYYFIPIMGLVLTAGYAGWIEYFNGKLKEPNSSIRNHPIGHKILGFHIYLGVKTTFPFLACN